MKKIFLVSAFLVSTLSFAQTKEQKVEKLMEVMGMTKNVELMFTQMMNHYAETNPTVPTIFWTKIREKINYNDLLEKMVGIYSKYYTSEDIDQLIKFYNTPVGKKSMSILPQIMQESMKAGEEWGVKTAEKVIADLEKEGYFQDPPMVSEE